MIPPAGPLAPAASAQQVQSDARLAEPRTLGPGGPVNSAARAMTPEAIDPSRAAARADRAAQTLASRSGLIPPDPNAPSGPPPAFDATPLEQLRLPLDDMAAQIDEAELRGMIRKIMTEAEPVSVPPPPEVRAAESVATVRSSDATKEGPVIDILR